MSNNQSLVAAAVLVSVVIFHAPCGSPDRAEAADSPNSAAAIDFERDIAPIFASRCQKCHGANAAKSGLRLISRDTALVGGDGGPAIRPGDSAGSSLWQRVAGVGDLTRMPPEGPPLTREEIQRLRDWIDQGASWPASETGTSGPTAKSDHWSFQPIERPELPDVDDAVWVRNPIDRFILRRLEDEGIRPSPPADRITLVRRLCFDLLGLPPTPEQVDAFVRDQRPDAYERLVKRLLDSPHFGERWGRRWLDLARYADSDGYEKDRPRPHAWRYRDWVIDAFNRDLPYDAFVVQQIAGDLLPETTLAQRMATGFHRNTLTNREGGTDPEEDRVKQVVDRVNTTGTVFLGLTIGCAQCHSHKYDPITQREYYGLYAFFNNADEVDVPATRKQDLLAYENAKARHAALLAALEADAEAYRVALPDRQAEWEKRVVSRPDELNALPDAVRAALRIETSERTDSHRDLLREHFATVDPKWKRLNAAIEKHRKAAPKPPDTKAQVLVERVEDRRRSYVQIRGDFLRPGVEVTPHTPAVLPDPRESSRSRLDLANWLISPSNPLTSRVAVNRIWEGLFGRGLVATSEDFGTRGQPPSHPELLDWLALEFQADSWSTKRMIRRIVESATYRQQSRFRPELRERDPNNVLLARQNRFRVSAEAVRDAFLAVSGLLHRSVGGPSVRPPLPADVAALGYANSVKWVESLAPERHRRGLYIFFQRTVPYPMLMTFDCPDSNVTCVRRARSNTPLQALTLLNDPVFVECAAALARRMLHESSDVDRLRFGFRLCCARQPGEDELQSLLELLAHPREMFRADPEAAAALVGESAPADIDAPEAAAWLVVARTLLNLDEFLTRE